MIDNQFSKLNDNELQVLYSEDLIFKKSGICCTEKLRKMLDIYCDAYDAHGIVLMESDLLREIANRWHIHQESSGCNCCNGDEALLWKDEENSAFIDSHGEILVTVQNKPINFRVKFCPNCGRKY